MDARQRIDRVDAMGDERGYGRFGRAQSVALIGRGFVALRRVCHEPRTSEQGAECADRRDAVETSNANHALSAHRARQLAAMSFTHGADQRHDTAGEQATLTRSRRIATDLNLHFTACSPKHSRSSRHPDEPAGYSEFPRALPLPVAAW